MKLLIIVLVVLPFLTACAQRAAHVKVLRSPTVVQEYDFSVKSGDVLVCDGARCRVLEN